MSNANNDENLYQNLSRKATYAKNKKRKWIWLTPFIMLISCGLIYLVILYGDKMMTYIETSVPFVQGDVESKNGEMLTHDNEESDQPSSEDPPIGEATIDQADREDQNPNYDLNLISNEDQDESKTTPQNQGEIILFGEEDMTLKGVNGNRDFYFTLPLSTVGEDSYVELTISSSDLLIRDLSSFTVLINDRPIKSYSFQDKLEFRTFNIPLDKEFFVDGVNKVSLQARLYIHANYCLDQTDPANWMVLHKTSYAFIDTKETTITDDLLNSYPYPFITSGAQEEVHTSIVIPDNSDEDIMKTALDLSQHLSRKTVSQQLVPVRFETEWYPATEQDHVIAIGTMDAWSGEMAKRMTFKDMSLHPDELYLNNTIEKTDNKIRQILFVSANNNETLIEKASLLMNEQITEQLTGNAIKITSMPSVEKEEVREDLALPIVDESLVLDDTQLSTQTFYLSIPPYQTIQGDGTFYLSLRASPVLREWENTEFKDQLGLTVYVNDQPYTVPLTNLLAEDTTEVEKYDYSFSIPKEQLVNQEIVTVSFEFNYPYTPDGCRQSYKSGNWVTIEEDSNLDIPYEIERALSLHHWPTPLFRQGEKAYDDVVFILPKNLQKNSLKQLSLIVHNLSRYSSFNNFSVVIGDVGDLSDHTRSNSHLIFFKGANDSFASVHEGLVVPWSKKDGVDLSPFGFITETVSYVSWIQPSYWNNDKAMVFFHSTDDEQSDSPYIHEKFFDLLGEVDQSKNNTMSVVNKANQLFTFNDKNRNDDQGRITSVSNRDIMIVIIIFSAVILLTVLLLWIFWRRKKKRGEYNY
ncbi:cellulose biosynthesis cyclic di-GMP-binding regulatory protein BcsB [Gracilibacillus sp. YIM 98692]|uniref:cellulose biosynthesis cyclic di-GMP-binding regulatory protein BcsB n=1 Tax=Gracilibacillus sp. YIM 98692 TaxID=2663532 RepID=UPI0013D0C320|nr:cellulose biosynthesis cyclic di-GMP-binding regulatory protein BcsB [Gracilibacillus sp. YIM 98692]